MNKKVEKRKAIGKQPLGTYKFVPEEVVHNYDWRIKMTYIPKIGDAVAARRKIKSKIYHNLLVGPIYDTSENSCVMVNERGTERETKWTLFYSDWDFEYLFPDEPVITTHNSDYAKSCDDCIYGVDGCKHEPPCTTGTGKSYYKKRDFA